MQFTKSEIRLIETIRLHGADNLGEALKIVFDIALFDSKMNLESRHKQALYQQNFLIKELGKVREE